jgi:predicted ATPase
MNCHYIAPVRATAERYYRLQDLAIDEIDFQGRNIAMYMKSFSEEEKSKFENWCAEKFDFIPSISISEGHVSIKINYVKANYIVNMTDVGFGYSQLLPIVLQLWTMLNNKKHKNSNETITLLIEQPELHLHPALQAKLIKTFISIVQAYKELDSGIRFILETHSESMINTLGQLVYKNHISRDEVAIYIFDKCYDNSTKIVKGYFNEDGFIENWPFGFFEPIGD